MKLSGRPAGPVRSLVLAGVLAGSLLVSGCGDEGLDPRTDNAFAARALLVDTGSRTAQAAAAAEQAGDTRGAEVFGRLAEVPQAIWLTPERTPPDQVGEYVEGIVRAGDDADRLPVLVVYGIPDRDCSGGYSAGGLDASGYLDWVQEIADAAASGELAVVVLEPDALASASECQDPDRRVELVGGAVDVLAEAGVATYLDGGHSHWLAPHDMAALLTDAGIDQVRGFATNVSNYQRDEDEIAYAERLSTLLDGAHYVLDRGRNGLGASEEWCNPGGRAFGLEPGLVSGEGGLDAYLWVKPPGESDGTCNDGPPAGDFWAEQTLEMAARTGW
ncbi:cellobiohydrolase [Nocardioides sp. dk4132]|uniref:glycoside hydrolase family 6 protein n=1 Tax=unclassified Nocardioides TaxID=2615069 RepID=UPI0012951B74|nr:MULTISPECIES: glycoside hydrolase family 6 protein [unclassified Nocardioides]MQW75886.1 cellobiohydrolase [Nocardioides sp. dk4132]QGA08749.1 cellobiohydrolase [Nocardioides sp. dk884]